MSIHLRPPSEHQILIFLFFRPDIPRLGLILFNLIIDPFSFCHTSFVCCNTFEFLLDVVLAFNEVTTFLTLEVESAAFPSAGGYGRVGLGEETFGFLITVSEGGEFASLELLFVSGCISYFIGSKFHNSDNNDIR